MNRPVRQVWAMHDGLDNDIDPGQALDALGELDVAGVLDGLLATTDAMPQPTSQQPMPDETDGPWMRLPKEQAKHYKAFCEFMRMGASRSVSELHRRYETANEPPTKRLKTMYEWSGKFQWKERAAAWDEHLAKLALEEERRQFKAGIDQMLQNMIKSGRAAQFVGAKALQRVQESLEKLDGKDIDPKTLPSFMRAAVFTMVAGSEMVAKGYGVEDMLKLLESDDL